MAGAACMRLWWGYGGRRDCTLDVTMAKTAREASAKSGRNCGEVSAMRNGLKTVREVSAARWKTRDESASGPRGRGEA